MAIAIVVIAVAQSGSSIRSAVIVAAVGRNLEAIGIDRGPGTAAPMVEIHGSRPVARRSPGKPVPIEGIVTTDQHADLSFEVSGSALISFERVPRTISPHPD